jgi:hypothetical protein
MPDWKKPDWNRMVRERIDLRGLPREAQEEVIAEVAAHLEDVYADGRTLGLGEAEASKRALSEIQWKKLARGIRRATLKEEAMNTRTKSLWLPAMVNLTTAAVLFMILEKIGAQPRMVQVSHLPVAFHLAWLFTLPLSAAAASFMARRAQAPSAIRLIAGLAPSLVALAVFVVMALVFEIDLWEFPSGFPLEFDYFALSAVGWIGLPAAPLLLGTLPFLRECESQSA